MGGHGGVARMKRQPWDALARLLWLLTFVCLVPLLNYRTVVWGLVEVCLIILFNLCAWKAGWASDEWQA